MHIKDETTHQRKVFARFDESDLYALLSQKVAAEAGFVINPRKTRMHVIIASKERTGTSGYESYAEVTLTNDLGEQASDDVK